MQYYFIYSAGGGAGDWNGVKRIWLRKMPQELKSHVLLKFGDLFFNHAPIENLIKPRVWNTVNNMREWLASSVNDTSVTTETNLLLDSGTSKIVNSIAQHNPHFTPLQIITAFKNVIQENNILEKYAEVIQASNINEAVTFDAPNPFKIRSQSTNTITNIFSTTEFELLIEVTAEYANKLYDLLGQDSSRILTTINGLWGTAQIERFISLLRYTPQKYAIGGLTRVSGAELPVILRRLNSVLHFENLQHVHFLGCGGIKNVKIIKNIIPNLPAISVDNSTPMNRAIDGNTTGTTQSGYFDYVTKKLHRIAPTTVNEILRLNSAFPHHAFDNTEMSEVLNKILLHQSGHSNQTTYDARAQLSFHNHDVFRYNAE